MYAIDEFNHRQIADELKISQGTSKWHLSNARQQLKEQIKHIVSKEINQSENKRDYK